MNKNKLQCLFISLLLVLTFFSNGTAADILSGRVYEGDKSTEPPTSKALSGVTVKLYGSNNSDNLGAQIGSTTTDSQGWYGLTATEGYEYYTIIETDPSNYYSVGATSPGGTVINNNKIRFSTGSAPLSDQTLTGNKFWDKPDAPANNPPVADANGPYTGTVGQSITLDGSGSTDPDAGDSIVSYKWDLDQDGQYDDATGVTVQHTWNSVYNGIVGLRVTDSYGETDTDSTSVLISEDEPETGTIIVEKQTEPDGSTGYFDFSGDVAGSIKDGEQLSVSNLQPGTYTSQEIVPQGWDLISIQCDDNNSSGDVNTATVTFRLEAGETVKAVFTNKKEGEEDAFDFGDAPDPSYPTLLTNNGARHQIDPDVYLGTKIDPDTDGQPNSDATGDDDDGNDDEDGVVIKTSLITGSSVNVEVTASTGGYLNAWVDFNQNGSWGEADDYVFIDTPLNAGLNNLTLHTPGDASTGTTIARFRFSRSQGLSYEGEAEDGEVEDYLVEIDKGGDGASVGDRVWHDYDQDGLQDAGEPGLDSVQVTLFDQNGNLITTTLTNGYGFYLFSNLNPDSYFLRFTLRSGFTFSPPDQGADDTIDSDAQLGNGDTPIFTLVAGDDISYMDAGMYKPDEPGELDFGDAPDSPESPGYPTLLANNGARHTIKQGFHLGAGIDAEPNGHPSMLSDGDDLNPSGGIDDEDGVTMSPFIAPGQAVPITIIASDTGVINAWLDFNVNGSWADAGEHFIAAQPVNPGANSFTLNVPGGATLGLTHARFRFSSVRPLSYDGLASDGEVEDYAVEITEPEEGSITVIKDATPKDNTPFWMSSRLGGGFGFFFFPLSDPTNNSFVFLNPSGITDISESSVPGWTLTGITITGDTDNGSTIDLANRNVIPDFDPGENIVITFKNKKIGDDDQLDFGDAPDPTYPTLLANNGARHKIDHILFLGSGIDSEPDGQPAAMATGDNQNLLFSGLPYPPGDEDGVLMPSIMTAGQSATISVISSASGVLNAWLDFNINSSWADAGEHIIAALPVVAGVNLFTINVPANAQTGQSYVRFRLSSVRNISYDGPAPDGEVEDYAVALQQGDGGNITIIKDATPKDDTPFLISISFGVNGGASYFRDPSANTTTITSGSVGTYNIGEMVPAGWTLTDIVVTGDSDNGSVINVSNGSAQIDLDAGENITVFFKNKKTGDDDQYDFGDAPPPYPTKLADNGAYHLIDPNFKFGKYIDAEIDGLPDSNAQGDDKDNLDDESEMSYVPGFLYFLNSNLEIPANSAAKICFCIDWERDDSWNNNYYDFTFINQVPFPLVVDLSAMTLNMTLTPGIYNARWRCYKDTSIVASPTGFGGVGEVEDCQFVVTGDEVTAEYDYGDAPLPYPTRIQGPPINSYGGRHPIVPGIHLGQTVDTEVDGQPNPNALGDDNDGNDDEDGVFFITPFFPGQPVSLEVVASVAGYLNGYIDLNQNKDWTDPNEQVLFEEPLVAGVNNLTFTLPANAKPGDTFARFRFSTDKLYISLPQQNVFLARDGEVEDYEIFIEEGGGEGPPIKWMQIPLLNGDPDMPYTPYFMGWNEQSVFGETLVADDWFCKSPRPVTEIHWWGSYADWDSAFVPPVAPHAFHIGIWTDVPAGEDRDWSHPGVMVMEWGVPRELLHERVVGDNFHPEYMTLPDTCFQYDYFIPESEWFYQEGDSTIYWLSIAALYEEKPDSFVWGWKTREHFFHDDAVRIFEPKHPTVGDFAVETEPVKHMWDMAFVLGTIEYFLEFDFGDAPAERYPTFFEQNGALHIIDPEVHLGERIDAEPDGQPDHTCTGDDLDGVNDDDGVIFTAPTGTDQATYVEILASRPGYLNAWMDFNNNGSWADSEEQIFRDELIPGGQSILMVPLPENIAEPPIFSRFRFSTEPGLSFVGIAIDGEVEDYYANIIIDDVAAPGDEAEIPTSYKLYQNYPNPFNPSTEIRYEIPEQVFVRLVLYNLSGQEIAILVSEQKSPGSYIARWNGQNKQSKKVAAGIYLYRLEAGNFNGTGKLLLLR